MGRLDVRSSTGGLDGGDMARMGADKQSPQRKPQVPDGVDRARSSRATTRYITCLMGELVSTCAHQLGLAGSGKTLAAAGEHYLVEF